MHFLQIETRRYVQFERLRHEAGLVHAFSTRPLDVASRVGPGVAERTAHRRTMAGDLGLPGHALRYCQQVHETRLTVVGAATHDGRLADCDGAVTALPGVPLMTFSADCPLILAYDPVRRVLGMAHASWRCTVGHMARHLIELLHARFECRPADLRVGIGPGAGPCCYEVKEDVYAAAAELQDRAQCFVQRDGRLYFDLWSANRDQLLVAGVQPDNIEVAGLCTLCHNDVFYSFRRERKGCGHFGLMAALREESPNVP